MGIFWRKETDILESCMGFSGDSVVKNPPASAGDMGSIPLLGKFPGEG